MFLSSTFQGGPRHLHEYAQDAMTYVRYGGKPTLFITYTFNPKCKEIDENLFDGQTSQDRHDLIARVFRQKLLKFLQCIVKGELFGPVKYWLYSVEWQKRGLPHAHILIWLTDRINPNIIDNVISAEIPNPDTDPVLHKIVISNMIQGPCGAYNPKSPCMENGKCTKNYPKSFVAETRTNEDG